MILGASYVVYQTTVPDEGGTFDISSEASPGYGATEIGSVFTCKHPSTALGGRVLTTEYELYLQKEDGSTVFMGYPYSISSSSISFITDSSYSSSDSGFLFIVKDGNVEGEKMKGQYMMTTLTTNHPGEAYTSKYKFNLYAANADIDKSELSNK